MKRIKYVKRFRFGLEAQIVNSINSSGYYSFKGGDMGGAHNYKEIAAIEYSWLKIWYWALKKVFHVMYKKINKKSWDSGYKSHDYKKHASEWGMGRSRSKSKII